MAKSWSVLLSEYTKKYYNQVTAFSRESIKNIANMDITPGSIWEVISAYISQKGYDIKNITSQAADEIYRGILSALQIYKQSAGSETWTTLLQKKHILEKGEKITIEKDEIRDFDYKSIPEQGSTEEIIAAYIAEKGIDASRLATDKALVDKVYDGMAYVFQFYMQQQYRAKGFGETELGKKADVKVPELFDKFTAKNENGREVSLSISGDSGEQEMKDNSAVIKEFYQKLVQMVEYGKPVLKDGKEVGLDQATLHHGTSEGDKRIDSFEQYKVAWELLYNDKCKILSPNDLQHLEKRFAEINKILGINKGKSTKFMGAASIYQMREGLCSHIEEMSKQDPSFGAVEDFHMGKIKMALARTPGAYPSGACVYGNDGEFKGYTEAFERDFAVLKESLLKKTNTQTVQNVLAYMETESTMAQIPGDKSNDHPDVYIRHGLLRISPDQQEHKIDEAIHKVCKTEPGVSSGFKFNVAVSDEVLGEKFKGTGLSVGSFIQQSTGHIIKAKTKEYIKSRQKEGIGSIVDHELVKKHTGVEFPEQEKSESKWPKVTKTPYRALASAMGMITQLVKMMTQCFQKMVSASEFYDSRTQEEFEKSRGVGLGDRPKELKEFMNGHQELMDSLCLQFRNNEIKAENKKIKEDSKKKNKEPKLLPEIKALEEKDKAKCKADIFTTLESHDIKDHRSKGPSAIEHLFQTTWIKDEKGKLTRTVFEMYTQWQKEKQKEKADEQKKKAAAEKRVAQEKPIILDWASKNAVDLLEEYKKLNPEAENFAQEEEELYKRIRAEYIEKTGKKTRDEYEKEIEDNCKGARTLGDYRNLCKVFQLHDALRRYVLGKEIEKEKRYSGDLYIGLTEAGGQIQHDGILLNMRMMAMKHAESELIDERNKASNKVEKDKKEKMQTVFAFMEKTDSDKAEILCNDEAEKRAMQKVLTNAVIGSGKVGNPPRGKYISSGIDTINPNKCIEQIAYDLVTIADMDKSLGELTSVIKQVSGFETVLQGKTNVKSLIENLKKSNPNQFFQILTKELGITAESQKTK